MRQQPFPIVSALSSLWAVLRAQPVAITNVTHLYGSVYGVAVGRAASRPGRPIGCGKMRTKAGYLEFVPMLCGLARFLSLYGVFAHTHALEA